ncbi:unnamed protein product [Blepharisma stoltei]|uniref:Uncharacterized protein n=1 Tax=Blepharisma stoltei TaxID=1481888 RepID=A0AAU9IIU6_9CILI|nr:unnamed protein product [Blepharisma stoltei]
MGSCINIQKKPSVAMNSKMSISLYGTVLPASVAYSPDKINLQSSSDIKELRRELWTNKAKAAPQLYMSKSSLYMRRAKSKNPMKPLSL